MRGDDLQAAWECLVQLASSALGAARQRIQAGAGGARPGAGEWVALLL